MLGMKARLAEPPLQALYGRGGVTVEPVFARVKRHRGFTRLRCCGHRAVSAEWTLVCLAHNLRMAIEPHPEDQKRGAYERIKLSALPAAQKVITK